MKDDQRNMFLAIALSLGVVMLWQAFFLPERPTEEELAAQQAVQEQVANGEVDGSSLPYPEDSTSAPTLGGSGSVVIDRDAALRLSSRVAIQAPGVDGSISLTGARFDDLHLGRFRETLDPTSPEITLLSPSGSEESYYVEFGWLGDAAALGGLPGATSTWSVAEPDAVLTPETPITLVWSNGAGLTFSRRISVDEDYMFTVTQSVSNSTNQPVTLHPYGLIARRGEPEGRRFWIAYEGLFGYLGGQRRNEGYKDLREDGEARYVSNGGWVGITDKYWMTALAPADDREFEGRFTYRDTSGGEIFQADYRMDGQVIPAGGSLQVSTNLFAGAKVVNLIDHYRDDLGIQRFDLAMDWGWFFFLTKPFFWALSLLHGMVGNFGVAILMFTVLVKLVFFPLANKSYESMAKMRKVQPQMEKIREQYADDKVKQQQETMELYKREKLNPLAGCLPMLIQIPVFFALYQVLFVTIEMRHAPFFGWIQDLSAPDPTSVFNLFGLMPWSTEALASVPLVGAFLVIGVWPLIMGFSMWFQMQLNPPPPDPMQRRIFGLMPIFFTFLLASFSAGLVIYWAWNNTLSIIQQTIIMKRQGVEVNPFEKMKLPGFIKAVLSPPTVPKVEHESIEPAEEAQAEDTSAADEDDAADVEEIEAEADDWDDGTDDPDDDDADDAPKKDVD